jgi:Sucrase/ferredoxin-like
MSAFKSLYAKTTSFLPSNSITTKVKEKIKPTESHGTFDTAPTGPELFPCVDPETDGPECIQDCESCTVHYPKKFSIDTDDKLYGHVKGWSTHVVVATGKSDWVRDVADEKGSVMEGIEKSRVKASNGVSAVYACNSSFFKMGFRLLTRIDCRK